METLGQIGEREIIRRLAALLDGRDDVAVGIGDDVAVVSMEDSHTDLLLTSDAVIEGIHFEASEAPERIGRKAIGRVLSDFAASGGEPMWAVLNVAAPPTMEMDRLASAYRGVAELAGKYGMAVVGGDTSSGPVFELHVFAVGRVRKGGAILRSGAREGDLIYVTGELGGSLSGKHLLFEPRIEEGLWLREMGWVSAMIDVSDGIATDLDHLLEQSKVGAELDAEQIPVSSAARTADPDRTPLEHALYDGEDYELLFTVPADRRMAFESSWADTFDLACTKIGRIIHDSGTLLLVNGDEKTSLKAQGFEHFS